MDSEADRAKAFKKAAKAQQKTLKKEQKHLAEASGPNKPVAPAVSASDITPAERSAAAAERQVKLQRFRVLLAFAALVVAAIGVFITLHYNKPEPVPTPTSAPAPAAEPGM